jgi:hypothetical protein
MQLLLMRCLSHFNRMGNKSVFDAVHLYISEFYCLISGLYLLNFLACVAHPYKYADGVIVLFSTFSNLKNHLKTTYAGMQSGN